MSAKQVWSEAITETGRGGIRLCSRVLGKVSGKRVCRWVVEIHLGERASLGLDGFEVPCKVLPVIAPTAREAGTKVQDELAGIPCREVVVRGLKGGVAWRSFRGWESAIGEQMLMMR